MAVIDFPLIRLAAASLFTPVSVSSYHITPQSADFICTGIRQHSKKVWPHNNRLWEPGISSPHICTSCCLSNCKNPTDPGIQLWGNRAFPQTATWNCCHPSNSLLSLVFFSALSLWCLNLLRCWKKNSSLLRLVACGKKKREMFLQIGGEKSSLCLNTVILFMSAQPLTCEGLHSHFLLPAVQRDALSAPSLHECSRKERQVVIKLLPHSQPDSGGKGHKQLRRGLEQTLT